MKQSERPAACFYCGRVATTIDHKIPKSKGGTDAHSNRLPACGPCNNAKGSMSFEAFTAMSDEDREKLRLKHIKVDYPRAPRVKPKPSRVASAVAMKWWCPECNAAPGSRCRGTRASCHPSRGVIVDHPAWVDPRP